MYLGRFHRAPLVIDGGASRARWIPSSHNIPGFTAGVSGTELLSDLRRQAARYGAEFLAATVSAMSWQKKAFTLSFGRQLHTARFVLLATGVKDTFPAIPGVEEAVLRSVMRFCPICDGFEASGKRIAVIGNGERGRQEAQFMFQTYSKHVSYLNLGKRDRKRRAALERLGLSVREIRLDELRIERDALSLNPRRGSRQKYDVSYSALGCEPQHQLAENVGAARDAKGMLIVNAHQQTTVDRLYAAGDIVRGLNQVVVGAAEAAIAATDIHNRLRAQGNRQARRKN